LLKQYLGPEPRAVLGDMSGPWFALDADTGLETKADALNWVFHARFGGRIELCKQGVSHRPFYVYDISSAYPAVAVEMPSMEGGKWIWKKNPTRAEVEGANILSVFKVKTRNFNPKLPFYPLPFRTETGSIMFPPEIIAGRYMRDDVIAAFKWFDYWNGRGELCDYSRFKEPPQIIVEEAMFFIPGDPNSRPLAFIKTFFDWRASLPKDDMRGQVLKLGINSIYGKFAQRVGKAGEPPTYGCLWYAAAITAGTRRKIIEGALTKPRAVAGIATDALFSDQLLPLDVPARKPSANGNSPNTRGRRSFNRAFTCCATSRARMASLSSRSRRGVSIPVGASFRAPTISPTRLSASFSLTFRTYGARAARRLSTKIKLISASARRPFPLRLGLIAAIGKQPGASFA
jgi:DNA polymerase type B, organellar and viral